jgi:hypothetical protein
VLAKVTARLSIASPAAAIASSSSIAITDVATLRPTLARFRLV